MSRAERSKATQRAGDASLTAHLELCLVNKAVETTQSEASHRASIHRYRYFSDECQVSSGLAAVSLNPETAGTLD